MALPLNHAIIFSLKGEKMSNRTFFIIFSSLFSVMLILAVSVTNPKPQSVAGWNEINLIAPDGIRSIQLTGDSTFVSQVRDRLVASGWKTGFQPRHLYVYGAGFPGQWGSCLSDAGPGSDPMHSFVSRRLPSREALIDSTVSFLLSNWRLKP